jgi:ATPase family associated with various cellular activities (AAA)
VLGMLSPLQLADMPARRVLRFNPPPPPVVLTHALPPPLQRTAQRALKQFHVDRALLDQALGSVSGIADESAAQRALWSALRESARGGLDALAQRIDSEARFDALVLPPFVAAQLREICSQLRHRQQVYDEWGFGEGQARGLGIAGLFAGESGTGKTMAAEAIANEAGLDLYRIDLASVVSKYIGETEKNLARLFDAAERSGAVLLFDEADAMFGRRSDVKDSHDRYANIEVAYLLQRIESYRGLAILTTNLKSALDRAFLRRIRFVVQFPMPDEAARAQIWRRQFPARAPLGDVDFARLARLQLSGGHIRSVALNAAFHAASRGEAITQGGLIDAARAEFMKLERPFGDALAREPS